MSYEAITLTLLSLRGVGPRSVADFLSSGYEATEADSLHKALLRGAISRLSSIPGVDDVRLAWERAERLIDDCAKQDVTILGGVNPLPVTLCSIPNPPLLLFVLGNYKLVYSKGIAVIGTREPTDFGRKAAHRMAHVLAENSWTVVSGLAEGCDTEGHEGCLAANGGTIAVLAHGFGRIYPSKNKMLSERILESGGCLATEYPPGVPPTKSSFIERDRLQSGLSRGIVVVETDVRGGTLHTVAHAKSQGRGIAALAHPSHLIGEPKAQGNQKLIREGVARPLSNRSDLIDFADSLDDKIPLDSGDDSHVQTTFDL